MKCNLVIIIVTVVIIISVNCRNSGSTGESRLLKANLVKKHLKRLKKEEGGIKLVGGREEHEGNVEILHNGKWGAICDDEWDTLEANIICKQLGFEDGGKPTYNSYFGQPRRQYWMDNIYCDGSELEITACRFDGWGTHDCDVTEAAGVICKQDASVTSQVTNDTSKDVQLANVLKKDGLKVFSDFVQVRLKGGTVPNEGRVEIKQGNSEWTTISGDGWSILDAMVVCRSLSLGFASAASQTDHFGGTLTTSSPILHCFGNETSLSQCLYSSPLTSLYPTNTTLIAAVHCTPTMADLVIDHAELIRTAHLEDRQLFFLQCAMEENCLASGAYSLQREEPSSWHLETRRLLRFTARILNAGTADFRPVVPKHLWEWHMCHMHYHSMEVFATFDIYNSSGSRVAEGHKASFCLEDNQCLPGVEPRFACANYGDQGISVNCTDIYMYTVDCQWVDITDIEPGVYTLQVAVNPEFKIAEMTYENNAARCRFEYTETAGRISDCVLIRP